MILSNKLFFKACFGIFLGGFITLSTLTFAQNLPGKEDAINVTPENPKGFIFINESKGFKITSVQTGNNDIKNEINLNAFKEAGKPVDFQGSFIIRSVDGDPLFTFRNVTAVAVLNRSKPRAFEHVKDSLDKFLVRAKKLNIPQALPVLFQIEVKDKGVLKGVTVILFLDVDDATRKKISQKLENRARRTITIDLNAKSGDHHLRLYYDAAVQQK